jgi:ABC-type multidrug transport system ATPase subunit
MAMSIVENMKRLASHGKTVIFTIHQPSSELFEMFDKIYLLSEGRLVYTGDLMNAERFFRSHNLLCPDDYNPADFYIKTLSISPFDRENTIANVKKLASGFHETESFTNLRKLVDSDSSLNELHRVKRHVNFK